MLRAIFVVTSADFARFDILTNETKHESFMVYFNFAFIFTLKLQKIAM